MKAGLDAGGWNVGELITDKRDRQASFPCYTDVHAVCELHKLRVALCWDRTISSSLACFVEGPSETASDYAAV